MSEKVCLIAEVLEAGAKDRLPEYKVKIIRSGFNVTQTHFFPKDVLSEAKSLFEGAPVYAFEILPGFFDHLREVPPSLFIPNLVGFIKDVSESRTPEGEIVLEGRLTVVNPTIAKLIENIRKVGKKIGLSINALAEVVKSKVHNMETLLVKAIKRVLSVDMVSEPAAGGEIEELLQSLLQSVNREKEVRRRMEEFLHEAIKAVVDGKLDEAKALIEQALQEVNSSQIVETEANEETIEEARKRKIIVPQELIDELQKIVDAIEEGQKPSKIAAALAKVLARLTPGTYPYPQKYGYPYPQKYGYPYPQKYEAPAKASVSEEEEKPKVEEPKASSETEVSESVSRSEIVRILSKYSEKTASKVENLEQEIRRREFKELMESKITGLPELVKSRIREQFTDKIASEEELDQAIKREMTYFVQVLEAARSKETFPRHVVIGESEGERYRKAMLGMLLSKSIDNVPPFRSLKHAWREIEKTEPVGEHVFESIAKYGRSTKQLLQESIESTDFPVLLGDTITRAVVEVFKESPYQNWQPLVSTFLEPEDFRPIHFAPNPLYSTLSTKTEGAAYSDLTTPSEGSEITLSLTTKGGLEYISLEAIANDDIQLVRRIIRSLGNAAALTVYSDFWGEVTRTGNYGTNIGGGNTGTSALSDASLKEVLTLMRKKKINNNPLGEANAPKFLIVPPDLEDLAYKLTTSDVYVSSSENATTPNLLKQYNIIPVIVDAWTDTNDWYVCADPKRTDTIAVAFYRGQREPEVRMFDEEAVQDVITRERIPIRVKITFGVKMINPYAFYRNVVGTS